MYKLYVSETLLEKTFSQNFSYFPANWFLCPLIEKMALLRGKENFMPL
jgi:hypothetical protein